MKYLYWPIFFFILFFYVYSVQFSFLPLEIGTRAIMGIVAIPFLILKVARIRNLSRLCSRRYIYAFVVTLIMLIIILLVSILMNDRYDLYLIKYLIGLFLIFSGGYLVVNAFKIANQDLDGDLFLFLFVLAVSIQAYIALYMAFNPAFREFILGLQSVSIFDEVIFDKLAGFRLIGFGSSFFYAGIVNGLALISVAYLFIYSRPTYLLSFILLLLFISIFLIGMNMSRTTLVGAVLSIMMVSGYFLSDLLRYLTVSKKLVFILSVIIITTAYVFIEVFYIRSFLSDDLLPFVQYAFEMFFSYVESGNFSSGSTNFLMTMYVLPENLNTYLYGDAQYFYSDGSYYKHIDVGYLRFLYYIGVPGLLLFLLLQFILASSLVKLGWPSLFIYYLSCYIVLLNFKGTSDIYILLFLLFFLAKKQNRVQFDHMKSLGVGN